jgi:multidrug efflux pump
VQRILLRLPESFGGSGEVNSARLMVVLDPWEERKEGAEEIAARVRSKLSVLPGVLTNVVTPQSLGVRGSGRPVEMVLGGPDYAQLREWRDLMLAEMQDMPELVNTDSDYQERKPQMKVRVDRDRAADLGVSLATVGRTLETMLGSRNVTTYVDRGREYNVILQGQGADRSSPDDLTNLYVRSSSTGTLIPLANLVQLAEEAGPAELNRFDRMRSISLRRAVRRHGLGTAVDRLRRGPARF